VRAVLIYRHKRGGVPDSLIYSPNGVLVLGLVGWKMAGIVGPRRHSYKGRYSIECCMLKREYRVLHVTKRARCVRHTG
jgi:hypothetical protein